MCFFVLMLCYKQLFLLAIVASVKVFQHSQYSRLSLAVLAAPTRAKLLQNCAAFTCGSQAFLSQLVFPTLQS